MSTLIDDADRLLTPAEVAKWARVSRSSLERLIRDGSLPKATFTVGERGPRWLLSDVMRHLRENSEAA